MPSLFTKNNYIMNLLYLLIKNRIRQIYRDRIRHIYVNHQIYLCKYYSKIYNIVVGCVRCAAALAKVLEI